MEAFRPRRQPLGAAGSVVLPAMRGQSPSAVIHPDWAFHIHFRLLGVRGAGGRDPGQYGGTQLTNKQRTVRPAWPDAAAINLRFQDGAGGAKRTTRSALDARGVADPRLFIAFPPSQVWCGAQTLTAASQTTARRLHFKVLSRVVAGRKSHAAKAAFARCRLAAWPRRSDAPLALQDADRTGGYDRAAFSGALRARSVLRVALIFLLQWYIYSLFAHLKPTHIVFPFAALPIRPPWRLDPHLAGSRLLHSPWWEAA